MGTGAWPRTMAVGERGWSAKETRDTDDALARFHEWRCKSESARRSVGPAASIAGMCCADGLPAANSHHPRHQRGAARAGHALPEGIRPQLLHAVVATRPGPQGCTPSAIRGGGARKCARNATAWVTELGLELCNETQLPQQCSVGPIIFLWLCASGSPSMKGLPRLMLH